MAPTRDVDPPRPSRRAWAMLWLAWLAFIGALLAWLAFTPELMIREQLKQLQFWSLEICVALGVMLGAIVVRSLVRELERRDYFRMVIVAMVAMALTVCVAPRTNRIFYDEQLYQSIAQNLADMKLAQICNDGTVEYGRLQCWNGMYNKQPYAYPHALSVVYRIVGVRASMAFVVNAMAMALTVCAVYLVVLLLYDDRVAAFFAALLLALIPEQIIWSATAAAEPSASLACIVVLLSAANYARSGRTSALAAVAVATAYAVQFRPESLLIVPTIAVLLWRRTHPAVARPHFWWVCLLAGALVAIHIAHLYIVRDEGWGTSGPRLSLAYLAGNLRANGRFYLGDARFPLVFTLLAITGLLGPRWDRARGVMLMYFFLFFAIYVVFYAGSYDYGADVRYSLMTYPPLAMLGGLGTAWLIASVERIAPELPMRAAITVALAMQFLWYVPLVRATGEEAWAARADVRFAKTLVPELQGNAYVLTHNPGMFHVWGINAGQISLATNPHQMEALAARYAGGVYLHWNFWCNVPDMTQQAFCRQALALTSATIVREYRERDQRYALYRLGPPVSHDTP